MRTLVLCVVLVVALHAAELPAAEGDVSALSDSLIQEGVPNLSGKLAIHPLASWP